METCEVKSTSWRARLWARLSDPDKRPRRWWFPPSSRRDEARRMPDAARQDYQKSVQQAHEKFSETVRLAMLSLLGFALFCLLITFSTPDSALLVADPTIKMPFADVQVSFLSFLILAPFLLIVVTLYLHIFYGYWLDLETDHQQLTLSHKLGEPPIERLPTLFSLDHPMPRLLTAFIFYWLVPLVLLVVTWKATARVEWGVPLVLLTGLVTVALVFLQIRRCPTSQRHWNRPLWGVMVLILGGVAAILFQFVGYRYSEGWRREDFYTAMSELVIIPGWLPRPLNIFRADLKGKWLAGVNLRLASAMRTNFQRADLEGANLQNAEVRGAVFEGANFHNTKLQNVILQGSNLQGAKFRDLELQNADLRRLNLQDTLLYRADLQGADLRGTLLRNANLGGADLRSTTLQDANLEGADLEGADLRGANLVRATLQNANLQKARFQSANLYGTMLRGANLQEARLQGVDLRETPCLTYVQIQAARIDEHTLLPDYLKRPKPAEPDEAVPPPAGTTPME
jgi:uncharacterized protein YjbI with pentapeptide repeats/FtsH-binding integral membrane protein